MFKDALKTILLVTATLALGFGIFIELAKLCNQIGISPWCAAVVYVGLYAWWWRNHWKKAQTA